LFRNVAGSPAVAGVPAIDDVDPGQKDIPVSTTPVKTIFPSKFLDRCQ